MYDPELIRPMREELTNAGVKELRSAADVDEWMADKNGTSMLVINSVCGCAAGAARPGVRASLEGDIKPDRVATVFAGQDKEATERARSFFADFPPSSPSIALIKEGEVVDFVPRHRIEGRDGATFGSELTEMYRKSFAS